MKGLLKLTAATETSAESLQASEPVAVSLNNKYMIGFVLLRQYTTCLGRMIYALRLHILNHAVNYLWGVSVWDPISASLSTKYRRDKTFRELRMREGGVVGVK